MLLQYVMPSSSSSSSTGTGTTIEGTDTHETDANHPTTTTTTTSSHTPTKTKYGTHDFYHLLVDCGKTFREVALEHFPTFGVQYIEAVLVTHGHCDAMIGMDDLREFNAPQDTAVQHQRRLRAHQRLAAAAPPHSNSPPPEEVEEELCRKGGIQVFADAKTMQVCREAFGYLFPKPVAPGEVVRWTASICWHLLAPLEVQKIGIQRHAYAIGTPKQTKETPDGNVKGRSSAQTTAPPPPPATPSSPLLLLEEEEDMAYIPVVPVPVLHGSDFFSNAFVFSLGTLPSASEAATLLAALAPNPTAEAVGLPACIVAAAQAAHFFYYISDVSQLNESDYANLEEAKWKLLFAALSSDVAPSLPSLFSLLSTSPPTSSASILPTALMVIDMLSLDGTYSTHMNTALAVEATRRVGASKTHYVGMAHNLSADLIDDIVMQAGLEGKAFGGYDGEVLFERPLDG